MTSRAPSNTTFHILAEIVSDPGRKPPGSDQCINYKAQGHCTDSPISPPSVVAFNAQNASHYKLKPYLLSSGFQALTQLISTLPDEWVFVDPRNFQPSPYTRSRASPADFAAISRAWRRTIQLAQEDAPCPDPAEDE